MNGNEESDKKPKRRPSQRLPCGICHNMYLNGSALRLHVRSVHKRFLCIVFTCGQTFETSAIARAHITDHHNLDLRDRFCDICVLYVNKPVKLESHYDSISHMYPEQHCSVCNAYLRCHSTSRTHLRAAHPELCMCVVCLKTAPLQEFITNQPRCAWCLIDLTTFSFEQRMKHVRNVHDLIFICGAECERKRFISRFKMDETNVSKHLSLVDDPRRAHTNQVECKMKQIIYETIGNAVRISEYQKKANEAMKRPRHVPEPTIQTTALCPPVKVTHSTKRIQRLTDMNNDLAYACRTCATSFDFHAVLRQTFNRALDYDTLYALYACPLCEQIMYGGHFAMHTAKKHSQEFNCTKCLIASGDTGPIVTCSTCNETCMDERTRNVHGKLPHSQCPLCCRYFSMLTFRRHYNMVRFICRACHVTHSFNQVVDRLRTLEHDGVLKTGECHVCKIPLPRSGGERFHLLTHVHEYTCHACGVWSANQIDSAPITQEIKDASSRKVAKRNVRTCEICNSRQKTIRAIKQHVLKHLAKNARHVPARVYDPKSNERKRYRKYTCLRCARKLYTFKQAVGHVNRHKVARPKNIFRCVGANGLGILRFLRDFNALMSSLACGNDCFVCGRYARALYPFTLHVWLYRTRKRHTCGECWTAFRLWYGAMKHLTERHDARGKCPRKKARVVDVVKNEPLVHAEPSDCVRENENDDQLVKKEEITTEKLTTSDANKRLDELMRVLPTVTLDANDMLAVEKYVDDLENFRATEPPKCLTFVEDDEPKKTAFQRRKFAAKRRVRQLMAAYVQYKQLMRANVKSARQFDRQSDFARLARRREIDRKRRQRENAYRDDEPYERRRGRPRIRVVDDYVEGREVEDDVELDGDGDVKRIDSPKDDVKMEEMDDRLEENNREDIAENPVEEEEKPAESLERPDEKEKDVDENPDEDTEIPDEKPPEIDEKSNSKDVDEAITPTIATDDNALEIREETGAKTSTRRSVRTRHMRKNDDAQMKPTMARKNGRRDLDVELKEEVNEVRKKRKKKCNNSGTNLEEANGLIVQATNVMNENDDIESFLTSSRIVIESQAILERKNELFRPNEVEKIDVGTVGWMDEPITDREMPKAEIGGLLDAREVKEEEKLEAEIGGSVDELEVTQPEIPEEVSQIESDEKVVLTKDEDEKDDESFPPLGGNGDEDDDLTDWENDETTNDKEVVKQKETIDEPSKTIEEIPLANVENNEPNEHIENPKQLSDESSALNEQTNDTAANPSELKVTRQDCVSARQLRAESQRIFQQINELKSKGLAVDPQLSAALLTIQSKYEAKMRKKLQNKTEKDAQTSAEKATVLNKLEVVVIDDDDEDEPVFVGKTLPEPVEIIELESDDDDPLKTNDGVSDTDSDSVGYTMPLRRTRTATRAIRTVEYFESDDDEQEATT